MAKEFGYKLLKPLVIGYHKIKYAPKIYGKENIPESGPLVFCANHRHAFDQFNVMAVTKRVIHYMSKEEYFEKRGAWFFRFVGCIKVDRRIHDENAKSEALDILNEGGCIGIFPEGTRNKTKEDLLPFKYGAVSLAKKSGALIVPFGIKGNYDRSKHNLVVNIGKPIDIKNMELEEANELLKENILKLMK